VGAALVVALTGLAGLPPGLAGLFAKVTVVQYLIGGGHGVVAAVVAVNAVVALAYYVRAVAVLYAPPIDGAPAGAPADAVVPRPVVVALAALTAVVVAAGFLPQPIFDLASR
jgi:NADH-quinone oxidoreductase subunit N